MRDIIGLHLNESRFIRIYLHFFAMRSRPQAFLRLLANHWIKKNWFDKHRCGIRRWLEIKKFKELFTWFDLRVIESSSRLFVIGGQPEATRNLSLSTPRSLLRAQRSRLVASSSLLPLLHMISLGKSLCSSIKEKKFLWSKNRNNFSSIYYIGSLGSFFSCFHLV